MDEVKRQKTLDDLCKQKEMADFLTSIHDRVFFIGAMDLTDRPDLETMKKHGERVLNDRETLLEYLFSCDKAINVRELDFVKQAKEEFIKGVENVKLLCQRVGENKEILLKQKGMIIKQREFLQSNKHMEHTLNLEEIQNVAVVWDSINKLNNMLNENRDNNEKIKNEN